MRILGLVGASSDFCWVSVLAGSSFGSWDMSSVR